MVDMRVCVPTMGNAGLDDVVCPHFGRAPTFTIVDLDTGEVRVVPNTSEHMGGAGKAPEIIHSLGVDVLICSNLGPRAISMLESLGIEVYVGASGTVREAIESWRRGLLQKASYDLACEMHGRGFGFPGFGWRLGPVV